jgi:hypothetical protein
MVRMGKLNRKPYRKVKKLTKPLIHLLINLFNNFIVMIFS